VLQWAADVLPLSYAVEALQKVAVNPSVDGAFVRDLVVLAAFVAGALGAAAATLRRRSA
jgi:ABC-2 type transport system permease protein